MTRSIKKVDSGSHAFEIGKKKDMFFFALHIENANRMPALPIVL